MQPTAGWFVLALVSPLCGQQWILRQTAHAPPPAIGAAMAFHDDAQRTVLFGGQPALTGWPLQFFAATWLFDGQDWSQAAPAHSPPARSFHCMVGTSQTAAAHRVILFGGVDANGSPLNDTWTWDGVDWTQHYTSSPPPPRSMAAMSGYGDGALLYGGRVGQPVRYLDDTWIWYGGQWSPLGPGPSARAGAALSEGAGLSVSMHGGRDATRPQIQETWRFENGLWTQLPSSGPAREAAVLAFDPLTRRHFLAAGYDASAAYADDLWRLDAQGWRDITPATRPTPALYAAGTLDSVRHRLQLFGGTTAAGASNELWEYESTYPVEQFGAACAGRGALPQITATAALLGSNAMFAIGSASHVPLAVIVFGFDDQRWGTTPLPVDLGVVGLPGCLLRVAPFATRILAGSANTALVSTYLAIPDRPALAGIDLLAQGAIVDALGVGSVTAAVRSRIF